MATPPAPTNLTVASGNQQLSLSWTASPGALWYTILRSNASGGPYTTVAAGIVGTLYNDTTVTNGSLYYYEVAGVNGSGQGPVSAFADNIPIFTIPTTPVGLVINSRNDTVIISWIPSQGAVSYNIYWSLDIAGPYTLLATHIPQSIFIDNNLINGASYNYKITAVNMLGESALSSVISITPPFASYFYVIQKTNISDLFNVMNQWNGSSYSLKFIFNPNSSNESSYGQCYCLWEKVVIPVS